MIAEDYSEMTEEDYDRILADIIKKNAGILLTIPGIYEIADKHFNNEVLARYLKEQDG